MPKAKKEEIVHEPLTDILNQLPKMNLDVLSMLPMFETVDPEPSPIQISLTLTALVIPDIHFPTNLTDAKQLQSITIEVRNQDLSQLFDCVSLISIWLMGGQVSLNGIKKLNRVESLKLRECELTSDFTEIWECQNLKILEIDLSGYFAHFAVGNIQ